MNNPEEKYKNVKKAMDNTCSKYSPL